MAFNMVNMLQRWQAARKKNSQANLPIRAHLTFRRSGKCGVSNVSTIGEQTVLHLDRTAEPRQWHSLPNEDGCGRSAASIYNTAKKGLHAETPAETECKVHCPSCVCGNKAVQKWGLQTRRANLVFISSFTLQLFAFTCSAQTQSCKSSVTPGQDRSEESHRAHQRS